MVIFAISAFACAAICGVLLATHVLRSKMAPWALSILHVLFAATGLLTLATLALGGEETQRYALALILFVVAALGGFFLASFHLRQKLPPKGVVILHAGIAIVSFIILLTAVV